MHIIDVEVDPNYISIIFDCILTNIFEIAIIPEGMNITFLVCFLHWRLIKEVGYL